MTSEHGILRITSVGLPQSTLGEAQRRRAFWGVMLAFLVHGLIVSTWISRIPSIKSALRLSDGAFGLALLGTAIGSVTAIPICGWLVTRYGSRRTAKWTSMGFCIALIPPALSRDALTLFLALLIYGAMAGANDVAMNSLAVGTEKLLGTPTISRFHAMFSAGGILGAGAGALIASLTGSGAAATLAHLVLAATAFLILAASMSRLMVDTSGGEGHKERTRFRRIPVPLLLLSAIGFCIFLSEGAIADWTGVYLKEALGAGDGLAPAGYAVFSVTMTIFRFSGDAITRRIGRALTIRLGGIIAAAGIALALSVHSPYWALAGFAAAGAGFSSMIPLVFAAGGRVAGISEGAGVATVSGLGYLGFLVGPPIIGFISQMASLRAGLFVLVFLSGMAAVLAGVVQRSGRGEANPLSDLALSGDSAHSSSFAGPEPGRPVSTPI